MREITIVGAGLAGLTAALRLQQAGWRCRIIEQYPQAGGLARSLNIGGEAIEAFYHHIFTTDTAYVALARELGLDTEIDWLPSRMGIFTDDRLWDFGTPVSLLKFRPLSMIDKIRFVLTTLRLQRIHDPTRFENVTAVEWLRQHQGERTLQRIWLPLLQQKFGAMADQVAMVWLWGKIYLRGRSRSRSGMGERLGYMRGSFGRLVDALVAKIEGQGGEIQLGNRVDRIERDSTGFRLYCRKSEVDAERVIVATQLPDYLEIAGDLLGSAECESVAGLRATSAICTILELDRSLSPYYWLNIADSSMPFNGLIEHTNYVSPERYGGRRILYISNYLFQDDDLFRARKSEVLNYYYPALEKINSEFDRSWVRKSYHFRAESAQPVVTMGYRDRIPAMKTSVPGLYLCTMAQIYPEDRGMNYAVAYGEKVARLVMDTAGNG